MDIVSRVCQRFVRKILAYTMDPRKVESQFLALENALHTLGAGAGLGEDLSSGEMFQSYSIAIDAYRDIMYYLRKAGVADGFEGKLRSLDAMSRHPFMPDEVLQSAGPHVFVHALGELHLLRQAFDALRGPQSKP